MDSKIIPVNTRPPYQVHIGPGLLASCGDILRDILRACRVAVVTEDTVAPLYLDRVRRSLTDAGSSVCTYIFPAGEGSKNLGTLGDILGSLAEEHLTRSDVVLALGGGVTGDMAGFAAAVYLRGIRYVQLPTTLLSAVDSSVGGKTAVDLRAGKNLAGAFCQPAAVLCDTDCLKTLPPHVLADGAAEAVKTGVLSGEALFSRLETGEMARAPAEPIDRVISGVLDPSLPLLPETAGLVRDPADIIARCVEYKAGVVERDERERGERRLLNLGHTVGHAIEKCSGYEISHGHAVAAGLGIISRAGAALGWTDPGVSDRIVRCLSENGLPSGTDLKAEELAEAALSDKKRSGDRIALVIPEKIGQCALRSVPVEELLPIIRAGM